MRQTIALTTTALSLFLMLYSCVTINIYFPAAAVEKAADRIVEEVWGEKEGDQPQKQQQEGEPESFLHQLIRFSYAALGPGEAHAQEADINVTTPAIRALKESIKDRAGAIKPYLDRGNAGLSKSGFLMIRSAEGLSLKDKAVLTRLIKAENDDRNSLYKEIVKANNFPPDRIADIQEIFARSWSKQAKRGWWIQDPGGTWNRKE
jgi:uncharacterized protein YdbL (DUF1318 family)